MVSLSASRQVGCAYHVVDQHTLYGWFPWNRLNRLRCREIRKRIQAHVVLFDKLFEYSKIVAQKVSESGGVIALEWPKGCDYWKFQVVQEFLVKHGLSSIEFDGCEFG